MPYKFLERATEKVRDVKARHELKQKAKRAGKNRREKKRQRRIKNNEPDSVGEAAAATVRQGRELAGELGAGRAKRAASTAGSKAAAAAASLDGGGQRSGRGSSRATAGGRRVDVVFSSEDGRWQVVEDNGRTVSSHTTKRAAINAAERKVDNSRTFDEARVIEKGTMGVGFTGGSGTSSASAGGAADGDRDPFVPQQLPFPGAGGGGGGSSGSGNERAEPFVPQQLPFPGPGGGSADSSERSGPFAQDNGDDRQPPFF